jgi:2-octaprenyl-6-methoxyphenol hydroxylase
MDLRAREIVIGGFGAAGAATALALVLGGVRPGDIAILDTSPAVSPPASTASRVTPPKSAANSAGNVPDARILALNAGSKRFLEALGVWPRLATEAHPMLSIAISDTALEEDIRPRLLDLSPEPDRGEPLAHLVPLGRLNAELQALCCEKGVEIIRQKLVDWRIDGERIALTLGEDTLSTRLLIGADGAISPIRVRAGISSHGWAYGQTGIVATIRHSLPHEGEAVQHFLPGGPFALLPLDEGRSSIVWTEQDTVVKAILAADPSEKLRAVSARAAGWRGDILAIETMSAHPLKLMFARRFFAERVALVADAAHVVHPLAGQGLNLGFEDCATLAELIVERLRLGLDPGTADLLEIYQARRRPAAAAMAYATEGLNRLFSSDSSGLRVVRDIGVGIVNRLPGLKARLAGAASGQTSLAPRLFRGEAI